MAPFFSGCTAPHDEETASVVAMMPAHGALVVPHRRSRCLIRHRVTLGLGVSGSSGRSKRADTTHLERGCSCSLSFHSSMQRGQRHPPKVGIRVTALVDTCSRFCASSLWAPNRAPNRATGDVAGRLAATGISGHQDGARRSEMASELRFCPPRTSLESAIWCPIPSTQQGISGL